MTISHKDQVGLALQAPHAGGIKILCYLRPERVSNNFHCNHGLLSQCGRFGPSMTTIIMGGHCYDVLRLSEKNGSVNSTIKKVDKPWTTLPSLWDSVAVGGVAPT